MNTNNTMSCHGKSGSMQKFPIGNGQVDIQIGLYPAGILHPSLGCPLIVEDPKKISIFILANQTFKQAFLQGNGNNNAIGATGGDNIRLVVNEHLKIHTWEKATDDQKNLEVIDEDLFGDDYREKIDCFYLGMLSEELHDRNGRHFANLRSSTKIQYSTIGLIEVFQIELKQWAFQPETLYDTFWVLRNRDPKAADLNQKYLDVRDRMVRQFVGKTWGSGKGAHRNSNATVNGPLCGFKVDAKQGITYTSDPTVPLQSRHPIFVPKSGKRQLNIGHLSDVHLSSRQHAYKGKSAAVIPGVDPKISRPIGDLANNNADNLFDILNQLATDPDVDVLVITGDLYDHIHNFDPTSRETPTTGKLWEALYLDSAKTVSERAKEYPYGIDALAVYSLLVHYYTHSKQKKPVLLISGNHEAYEFPYGISPRLAGARVNEGIPLDHNLTIYEAILLYGPGYGKVLKPFNFAKENFDWFSTVFTPLADFSLNYRNQCLLGVEWGDDESFVRSTARGGGTLPRATKSLSNQQRALIESTLRDGKETVFCSHFTLVNYSLKRALEKQGVIDVKSVGLSDYDHGSSHADRTALYERFLNHPKLRVTLSGHSHRVGLYACNFKQETRLVNTVVPAHLETRGHYPKATGASDAVWTNRTSVFVTASTGPIPKQNLQGEMSGQGMEYPSAGKIVFNGDKPEITLIKCRSKTAKPRFAVACDYIDIMEGGFWKDFRAVGSDGEFELKINWEKIHPKFPADKKVNFIENVTLWLVGGVETTGVAMSNKKIHRDALRLTFSSDLQSQIEFFGQSLGAIFLSFKFSKQSLADLPGFKDYDYDSPWNIQVGIYDDWGREVVLSKEENQGFFGRIVEKSGVNKASTDSSRWQIMRHKKDGEVPSFLWRCTNNFSEYNNKLKRMK